MAADPTPDLQASAPTRPADPAPNEGLRLPEEAAMSIGSKRTTEYDQADQIGADLVEQGMRKPSRDEMRPVEQVDVTPQRPRGASNT